MRTATLPDPVTVDEHLAYIDALAEGQGGDPNAKRIRQLIARVQARRQAQMDDLKVRVEKFVETRKVTKAPLTPEAVQTFMEAEIEKLT